MSLWIIWIDVVWQLRFAFSRQKTFLWAAVALAGFCTRCGDCAGIGSIVRALTLEATAYAALRRLFHSSAVNLGQLTALWTKIALKIFGARVVRMDSRPILIVDGLKNPKEGRKMPGVKLLHQESGNNSKPEFIMAHSCQCVSILVEGTDGHHFAVPLAGRIHDGVKFTNRDHRTLFDKLMALLGEIKFLGSGSSFVLVADAYYACKSVARTLLADGSHLLTRVRSNAVAFEPAAAPARPCRGRPRLYGKKIKLHDLFTSMHDLFVEIPSPLYNDGHDCWLRYLCLDLLWRPLGRIVRFVLVDHPTRGWAIFFSTDLAVEPEQLIALYGLRFKIEVAFKAALHDVGAFAYRFWLRAMKPLTRKTGTQHLHHQSNDYCNSIRRKLAAFEIHIQLGLIAQGLLQFLALTCRRRVWREFRSWLVTMNPHATPSEAVTARALTNTLQEFLQSKVNSSSFEKFLRSKIDDRLSTMRFPWRPPKKKTA